MNPLTIERQLKKCIQKLNTNGRLTKSVRKDISDTLFGLQLMAVADRIMERKQRR